MVKELKRLNEKQTSHNTHCQFIKDSLRKNLTLQGLQIKTTLQAKDTNKRLRKGWKKINLNTQIQLLELLQTHHKEESNKLQNEITDQEQQQINTRS